MVKDDFIKVELVDGLFRIEILSPRTFTVDSVDIWYCAPEDVGETVQELIDMYTIKTNDHDISAIGFKVQ